MSSLKTVSPLRRYTGWLPAHPAVHKSFIAKHVKYADVTHKANKGHVPAVEKFGDTIRNHPTMAALFDQIFLQVSEENKVKDFDMLLHMLDGILVAAPSFHIAKDEDGHEIGEPIGVPVYLLFDLLSNTGAAHDLFRMKAFNDALKELLDSWGKFLTTEASNNTLTDDMEGWFSLRALTMLEDGRGKFNTTWVCPNPNAVNRGFTSWDRFFTREYQSAQRPVRFPEDQTLLHSACESTVYRIAYSVKAHEKFWLKGQEYSLYDMLNKNEQMSKHFVGGTVYQAFLSPLDYHRWRCPVNGTIVKTELIPGTYYAVLPDDGAPEDDPDLTPGDPRGALIRSQAWITMYAARALIYIQADNPDVNLMCFIAVGMAEVSTCEISVQESQKVKAGDELGMFHFGGSSHTLIFGPKTKVTFADHVKPDKHQLVNSIIGQFGRA